MILHHHHRQENLSVFSYERSFHTQLVKNVIRFRFDQSDDDDDTSDVYIHRYTIDRQISRKARKMTFSRDESRRRRKMIGKNKQK